MVSMIIIFFISFVLSVSIVSHRAELVKRFQENFFIFLKNFFHPQKFRGLPIIQKSRRGAQARRAQILSKKKTSPEVCGVQCLSTEGGSDFGVVIYEDGVCRALEVLVVAVGLENLLGEGREVLGEPFGLGFGDSVAVLFSCSLGSHRQNGDGVSLCWEEPEKIFFCGHRFAVFKRSGVLCEDVLEPIFFIVEICDCAIHV